MAALIILYFQHRASLCSNALPFIRPHVSYRPPLSSGLAVAAAIARLTCSSLTGLQLPPGKVPQRPASVKSRPSKVGVRRTPHGVTAADSEWDVVFGNHDRGGSSS
eukprot:Tamp_20005.p1 GENE.Tamp_20005~~Tamp_20005.p1  ORF type:complete len:106 (-),score=2.55 Tamp_20005:379-696(-)